MALNNNAAMAYFGWMEEITVEDYIRTINEDLVIVFRFCKAAWPHLVARHSGSIINTASTSGKIALKVSLAVAHTSAKRGVLAMTRQLAMEGQGVVRPGLSENFHRPEIVTHATLWVYVSPITSVQYSACLSRSAVS